MVGRRLATGGSPRRLGPTDRGRQPAYQSRDDCLARKGDGPTAADVARARNGPDVAAGAGPRIGSERPRRPYSALTAAVSAARPSFASAKSMPVFSFV